MSEDAAVQANAIVLIDDSPDDQLLFSHLLRRAGLERELINFTKPLDAVKYLARVAAGSLNIPVAVFIDVHMPVLNGFDVLQALRAMPELDRVCAIMLSSSDHPRDIADATKFGAQCYLTKFPSTETLTTVVEAAVKFAGDRAKAHDDLFKLVANLLTE